MGGIAGKESVADAIAVGTIAEACHGLTPSTVTGISGTPMPLRIRLTQNACVKSSGVQPYFDGL